MLTKQEMVRYTCSDCGKSFDRSVGVEGVSCPFCKPISEFEFNIPELQNAMEDIVSDVVSDIINFAESSLDGARDRIYDEIHRAMKDQTKQKGEQNK
jgi:hypothetical protein